MKSIIVLMGIFGCSLGIAGCDGGNTKQDQTDPVVTDIKKDSAGVNYTNFCLTQEEGEKMIATFEKEFRTVGGRIQSAITPSIMIESKVIVRIAEYLKPDSLNGLRIYFGASQFEEFPAEEKKNKIVFIGVPTIIADSSKHHPDDWNAKIGITGKELKLDMTYAAAKMAHLKFKEIYRGEQAGAEPAMDNFSKAVWIDKALINNMAALLTSNPGSLSGFRLYAGAYDSTNTPHASGRKYDLQSTILLVPINKSDGSPNWEIFKECNITDKAKRFDAANHGELCPKNCPPTEPTEP